MSDECLELKNIKYKTMLLNGNNKQFDISKSDKISIVDNFLETENKKNGCEPWSKLDKTRQLKKINIYVSNYNKLTNNNYKDSELNQLKKYLIDCLNK